MARDGRLPDDDFRAWVCSLKRVVAYLERIARAGQARGSSTPAWAVPLDLPVRHARVKERSDGYWAVELSGRSFTLPPLLGLLFALLAADDDGADAKVVRPRTRRELRAQLEAHRGTSITVGALAQALTRLRDRLEMHEMEGLLEYCVAVEGYRLVVSPAVGKTINTDLIKRLRERAQAQVSAAAV